MTKLSFQPTMLEIKDFLKKYEIKPLRYQKLGKATIVDTSSGSVVIKPKEKNNKMIQKYLESRSFNYHPKIINQDDDNYEIMEYIEEYDIPNEQKMLDMIDLISLLHNKTTHYKEITEDYYKELYEDLSNNIFYLVNYYNDLLSIIETKVYMSPAEYVFARNSTRFFSSLNFCKQELENWYELVKEKKKTRFVVIHNNLDLSHFLRNKNSYLISWEKAKIDSPVFEIYKLYRKNGIQYDFTEILKRYESSYPLLESERKLLFILCAMPIKLELSGNIYEDTKKISYEVDLLFKTEILLSPYYMENRK